MKDLKIYLASSWRNWAQPFVLWALRREGYETYDFRRPAEGVSGFSWSDIDPDWEGWEPWEFVTALDEYIAQAGFDRDWAAMMAADVCVLLLPCGRSAHLEAGWFAGQGKRVFILLDPTFEPELMYGMAKVCCDFEELLIALGVYQAELEGCEL